MNPILNNSRWHNERLELPFQKADPDRVYYGTKDYSSIHWQFGPGRRIIRVPKYGKEERNSLWTLAYMVRWIPGGVGFL